MRRKHNDKRTAYNNKYRAENREAVRANERNYYLENSAKLNQKSKEWRDGNGKWQMLHIHAQKRAKQKGIAYNLTAELIKTIGEGVQKNRCALTGIEFSGDTIPGCVNRPFWPSIDRRDNAKGYTFDNVQILCIIANKAKNDFPQEMFDRMCEARVRKLNG